VRFRTAAGDENRRSIIRARQRLAGQVTGGAQPAAPRGVIIKKEVSNA